MYRDSYPLSTRSLTKSSPLFDHWHHRHHHHHHHHHHDDEVPSKPSPDTALKSWCKMDTYRQKSKTPTNHLDTTTPCIDTLCEQFTGMLGDDNGISLTKLYPMIPDHDKRILNCMMLKRFNNTMDVQNSWIAREYWERERSERIAIQQKQHFDYKKSVGKKHEVDKYLRAERLDALCRQHENYVTAIEQELRAKKLRSKNRLAKAEYERNLLAAQRQLHEKRRFEDTSNTRYRQQIDEQLKSHECGIELDRRMQRATCIRKHHLNNYRKRITNNNERQQMVHAMLTKEIREAERMQADYLKEKIAESDRRSHVLRANKLQWVEESRDRAQLTASLRDIVRKSVTPDNFLCTV